MQRVSFMLNGREFSAAFDTDGECVSIYSYHHARFLNEDSENNEREMPHVWTAAYTMRET